jgi:hypothetical protein
MSEELYIVNTQARPSFLNPDVRGMNPERAEGEHSRFIAAARRQYSGFGLPYIALLPGGGLIIPAEPVLLMHQVRRDGSVTGSGTSHPDMALDDFIEMHRKGDDTLFAGRKTPITAVVEFSPEELYPGIMQRLAQKYDIRRITV